jgi:hypothetical protein
VGSNSRTVDFHRSVDKRDTYQFFRKPELLIEFDTDDPSFRPSLELIGEAGKTTGITRHYLKVKVSNHGDVMASRCRAKLKVIGKSSSRSPSDAKFLCWDMEPNRFIDIGAHDDELLHVVFTQSNFESNHKNGELDIYALTSTVESLHDEAKFIRAQDALGLGYFKIEINVRDGGGVYANNVYELGVDKLDKPFSLKLVSHNNSLNTKNFIPRFFCFIYNKLKKDHSI